MGKYQPLTHYLEATPEEIWDARFSEVEKVLGFSLPPSAHAYAAWWANQEPGHSQTRGWRDAGWETSQVDLASKKVRFYRRRRGASLASIDPKPTGPNPELLERARRLSGIEDRDVLLDAALTAFVHREASRRLAELGGSMPDFEAPARERPDW